MAPFWVWAVALGPRLILCALAVIDPKLPVCLDSVEYLALAQNLISHGVFSSADSAPFIPNTFRTPGYPAFLSLLTLLPSPVLFMALVQSFLGAWTAALFWNRLNRWGFGRGADWGALALALDPVTVLNTPLILAEPVFNFFLVLALIATWGELRAPRSEHGKAPLARAAGAGLFWSLSAFVRPISLFLPLFLCWVWRRDKKVFLVFLASAYLLPVLWSQRNRQATGAAVFAAVGGHNVLRGPAAMVESMRTGRPWVELDAELRAQVNDRYPAGALSDTAQSSEYGKLGRKILREHPFLLAKHCAGGAVRLLGGTGLEMILAWIPFRGPDPQEVQVHAKVTGQGTLSLMRRYPWLILVQIFYVLALASFYILALLGLLRLWREGRAAEAVFLLGCAAYFLALSSGAAAPSPRYRIPILPFLAGAAAIRLKGNNPLRL